MADDTIRKIYRDAHSLYFSMSGKKPWKRGYIEYRQKKIIEALDCASFDASTLPEGFGFRLDERIVEYSWLLSRLPQDVGKLLDAGSVLNFDFILKREQFNAKNIYIMTLAPEDNCFYDMGISYLYGDLRNTSFKDSYFDWVVSISTIEHIGMDNTMLYTEDKTKNESEHNAHLDAVREYKRILKPGARLYLSFPFGLRKDYGWFQVFDSDMLDHVISEFSPASLVENHYRYAPTGWKVSSREESKDATYFDIHTEDDYGEDFAAASRAIVTLELTK
jgi:SAM-dependent methyltransferase